MNPSIIIKEKLEKELPGSSVEVIGEGSCMLNHNRDGHFDVKVIYNGFRDKSIVEQHQIVYNALKEEMKSIIHALVIKTKVE